MKTTIILLLATVFAAHAAEIADFENEAPDWEVKPGGGLTMERVTDAAHVKEGKGAARIEAIYDSPATGAVSLPIPDSARAETGSRIVLWLFGGGSDAGLQFSVVAEDGGIFTTEKKVNWDGWQEVEIPLDSLTFNKFAGAPEDAAPTLDPAKITTFRISTYPGLKAVEEKQTFYVDAIRIE